MPNGWDDSGSIDVDFGNIYSPASVQIRVRDSGGNAPGYTISVSSDGSVWTQVFTSPSRDTGGMEPGIGWTDYSADVSQVVRYVRIFYSYGGGGGPRTAEFDSVKLSPSPVMIFNDNFDTVSSDWVQTRVGMSSSALASASSYLYANYEGGAGADWYGVYGTRTVPTNPITGDYEIVFDGVTAPINNPSGAIGQMFIEVLDASGGSMYSWVLNDAWTLNEAGVNLSWQKNGSVVFQEFIPDTISPYTAAYSNYNNTIKFKKVGSTIYFYKDGNLVYSGPASSGSLSQIRINFSAYSNYPTYGGNLKVGGVTITTY